MSASGGRTASNPLVVAAVANPAAGAEISIAVPVTAELMALQFILGTSATFGERVPFLVATVGAQGVVISSTPRGQPPSTPVQYQCIPAGGTSKGPIGEATNITFPPGLVLPAGATLSTFTVGGRGPGTGLDTTDQYSFVQWAYQPA